MAGLVNVGPQRVQTGRGLRLDAVRDTAVLFGLEDIAYRARLTAEQSTQTRLTVAVLGQFKAGKSSMLNDLIEAPLLPVGALPATSVVTVVSYGASARATVTLLSGEERTVGVDELDLYVTEQHNPGNHKKVAQVSLTTPALAAYRDLELVDTPGLGSLFDSANAVTTGWLPHTSSALVAVNATQPLSAADLDLIVQLKAFTPDIAIVLTKTDLLTQSELAEVRDFTEQHVRRSAGLEPSVLTLKPVAGSPDARGPDGVPAPSGGEPSGGRPFDNPAPYVAARGGVPAVPPRRARCIPGRCPRGSPAPGVPARRADPLARDPCRSETRRGPDQEQPPSPARPAAH